MNILSDIYNKRLLETEKNIKFWEEYLHNLNALDFNLYSDKLTVPILVPIGNKILFRGSLQHTNEVTVALGADYFTKCSTKQAEILRLHRIKDAKSKLEEFNKEKNYIESQISFSKEIIQGNQGQDIIEVCSEEEDRVWREKHKERVKQYYQNKAKEEIDKTEIADEDLWSRLEELELQEELEKELGESDKEEFDDNNGIEYNSFIIKEDDISNTQSEEDANDGKDLAKITHHIPKQTSKINLLQQVISRQKMLEEKLSGLKNSERVQSKTESDLLSRLDEIEQLDELEDEMDRLDDIIHEDDENVSVKSDDNSTKVTRSVLFADEDNSETSEITYKHSNIEPSKQSYNQEQGITKPSDLYTVYPTLFANETTSILKKSKYDDKATDNLNEVTTPAEVYEYEHSVDNETIVIKDVVEKSDYNGNKVLNDTRPTSLFKKKRLQQKHHV